MAKPVIVIYYAGIIRSVKVPTDLDVEIQFMKEEEKEEDLFFTYQNVKIYNTIWKDMGAAGACYSEYWFGLMPGLESDSEYAFDVRDIPDVPVGYNFHAPEPDWDETQKALAYAIEQGWIDQEDATFPASV